MAVTFSRVSEDKHLEIPLTSTHSGCPNCLYDFVSQILDCYQDMACRQAGGGTRQTESYVLRSCLLPVLPLPKQRVQHTYHWGL